MLKFFFVRLGVIFPMCLNLMCADKGVPAVERELDPGIYKINNEPSNGVNLIYLFVDSNKGKHLVCDCKDKGKINIVKDGTFFLVALYKLSEGSTWSGYRYYDALDSFTTKPSRGEAPLVCSTDEYEFRYVCPVVPDTSVEVTINTPIDGFSSFCKIYLCFPGSGIINKCEPEFKKDDLSIGVVITSCKIDINNLVVPKNLQNVFAIVGYKFVDVIKKTDKESSISVDFGAHSAISDVEMKKGSKLQIIESGVENNEIIKTIHKTELGGSIENPLKTKLASHKGTKKPASNPGVGGGGKEGGCCTNCCAKR